MSTTATPVETPEAAARAAVLAERRAKALEGVDLDGPETPEPGAKPRPVDSELAKLKAQPAAAATPAEPPAEPEPVPEPAADAAAATPAATATPTPAATPAPTPTIDVAALFASQTALAQKEAALAAREAEIAARIAQLQPVEQMREQLERVKAGDKHAALQVLGLTAADAAKLAAESPGIAPEVAASMGETRQLKQQIGLLAAQVAAIPHITEAARLLATDDFELCRLAGVTPERVAQAVVSSAASGKPVTVQQLLADHEKSLEPSAKAIAASKKLGGAKAAAPAAAPTGTKAPAPPVSRAAPAATPAGKKEWSREQARQDALNSIGDI